MSQNEDQAPQDEPKPLAYDDPQATAPQMSPPMPMASDQAPFAYDDRTSPAPDGLDQVNMATAQDSIVTAAEASLAQRLAAQNMLDADVLAALQGGNPVVTAAVLGGAVTNAQIVDAIIRSGNTEGLPPTLAAMVNQTIDENEAKRRAENRAVAGMVAGLAGGAMWANRASAESGNGLSEADVLSGRSFDLMTDEQKERYFGNLARMSRDEYDGTRSDEEKANDLKNRDTYAETKLKGGGKKLTDLIAEMEAKGITPEEIASMADIGWTKDGKPMAAADAEKEFAKLPPHLRDYARQRFSITQEMIAAGASRGEHVVDAAKTNIAASTLSTELANAKPEAAPQRAATYEAGTQAIKLGEQAASTTAEQIAVQTSTTSNLEAGKALHNKAVASTAQADQKADGFDDDEPAQPAKVATAAPAAIDHRTMSGVDRMNVALAAFTAPEPAPALPSEPEQKRQFTANLGARSAAPTGLTG